jgi:DNA-binding NarL/FixJ family response regulator
MPEVSIATPTLVCAPVHSEGVNCVTLASVATNRSPADVRPRPRREVAELIAQGLSNEEIVERLVVTTGTVANHVAHILTKPGMRSRVEIANDRGRTHAATLLSFLAAYRML